MSEFESFDYTKVTVAENQRSQYMDGYEHFGWRVDSNVPIEKGMGKVTIHLKRSRAVLNKMELTRLQRHFEACMSEIAALENSTESFAMIAALTSGISGCAFIAENPKTVEEFHSGKEKVLGFLVGQVMKKMRGKADPGMVNELLRKKL